jgi:hypothetical protein
MRRSVGVVSASAVEGRELAAIGGYVTDWPFAICFVGVPALG